MSVATNNAQLPKLAKDLVRPGVRAILAVGPLALRAARTVTATIPIVALDLETDPVKAGFAESLSHPSGNVTGLFFDFPEFSGKLLGLLQKQGQAYRVWPHSGIRRADRCKSRPRSLLLPHVACNCTP